jgi:hypothetical protein
MEKLPIGAILARWSSCRIRPNCADGTGLTESLSVVVTGVRARPMAPRNGFSVRGAEHTPIRAKVKHAANESAPVARMSSAFDVCATFRRCATLRAGSRGESRSRHLSIGQRPFDTRLVIPRRDQTMTGLGSSERSGLLPALPAPPSSRARGVYGIPLIGSCFWRTERALCARLPPAPFGALVEHELEAHVLVR